jgi:hypothetical protein
MALGLGMKIAFDLDGVLIPDFKHIPNLNQTEFYQYTFYAKPLIQPNYDFDVVTARDEKHRAVTEQWLNQLDKKPNNVFMNIGKLGSSEFKFQMVQLHQYDMYVESDLEICNDIEFLCVQNNVKTQIIHFDSFICNQLLTLNNSMLL